ncbi:ribosomal protein S18 acetylase RimI-like enzyme [Microbacterium sp. ZKA21]|uniref:GNAT family N-acetyltransferase n=1 Tax=Microbacterium sp. ZKA21 TaxID=3381694 RepID=UPI003D20E1DD
MPITPSTPVIRGALHADTAAIGEALRAYLVQTETEKIQHGVGTGPSRSGELPPQYRAEVDNPTAALSDHLVLVAEIDRTIVGIVVLKTTAGASEIKRLWTSPVVRGRGIGSALLDEAITLAGSNPVTLTVWDWREAVVRMYVSRGFAQVESWDERPRLICMRRDARAERPTT